MPTLSSVIRRAVTATGWGLRSVGRGRPRDVVTLTYHGVPRAAGRINAEVFEQHVRFLRRHFELVAPESLDRAAGGDGRIQVLLTFDDGLRNHYEVVAPILRRYEVPAVFFVCSRHAQPRRYLWFTYLEALIERFPHSGFVFRGEFQNMSAPHRAATVARLRDLLLGLRPHPAAMYAAIDEELPPLEDFVPLSILQDRWAGLTAEQIGELAADPLFTVGVHTCDHPLLTRCAPEEAAAQIERNRQWIESVTGRRCDSIAYPGSDYDAEVLRVCRGLGLQRGYSLDRRLNIEPDLEVPRIGVYYPSPSELGCKVRWSGVIAAGGRYAAAAH